MSSWPELKSQYQARYNDLSNYRQNELSKDVQALSEATAKYISKGGISQDPANNADYNTAVQISNKIKEKRQAFQTLNKEISSTLQSISRSDDMGRLLLENGNLQQEINQLEKDDKTMEQDVKSSELRDELLRSRESNITKHQIYLLGRPLRPSSIPYLWAMSVLFIGIALIIFYQFMPPLPTYPEGVEVSWLDMIRDPRIVGTLAGALAIVNIFLALKVANII